MPRLPLSLSLFVLLGCPGSDSTSADSSAVGVDDSANDTGDGSTCAVRLTSSSPAEGAVGVYIHDPLTLNFSGDATGALIEVLDPEGVAAVTEEAWQAGNLSVQVTGEFAASTDYTLHVEVCGVTQEVHYRTSELGGLSVPVGDLSERTYVFSLADAEITEPTILEAFDDASLTTPLGFMVLNPTESTVDILGASLVFQSGEYTQASNRDTWSFPTSDFTAAPFFEITTDQLTFIFSDAAKGIEDTPVTLYAFSFDGTFNPDGTAIVNGNIDTLIDTRGLGPLLNVDDTDGAVCDLASTLSVTCTECPDGEPYCLHAIGEGITAPWVEGFTIKPYPAI